MCRIGQAEPDEALMEFDIPTNPIRWALSLVPEGSGAMTAFGGGYFDDAGTYQRLLVCSCEASHEAALPSVCSPAASTNQLRASETD
jgi:hypothetical protein